MLLMNNKINGANMFYFSICAKNPFIVDLLFTKLHIHALNHRYNMLCMFMFDDLVTFVTFGYFWF